MILIKSTNPEANGKVTLSVINFRSNDDTQSRDSRPEISKIQIGRPFGFGISDHPGLGPSLSQLLFLPLLFLPPPPKISLFYDYCPSAACKSSPSGKKKRGEAHNQTNCRLGKSKLTRRGIFCYIFAKSWLFCFTIFVSSKDDKN